MSAEQSTKRTANLSVEQRLRSLVRTAQELRWNEENQSRSNRIDQRLY